MTPEVQRWIAAVLVIAALAYVAVRAWRQVVVARRARECGLARASSAPTSRGG